jgi:hypothetical protein
MKIDGVRCGDVETKKEGGRRREGARKRERDGERVGE